MAWADFNEGSIVTNTKLYSLLPRKAFEVGGD